MMILIDREDEGKGNNDDCESAQALDIYSHVLPDLRDMIVSSMESALSQPNVKSS
jgi:hypothetical protein